MGRIRSQKLTHHTTLGVWDAEQQEYDPAAQPPLHQFSPFLSPPSLALFSSLSK